MPSCRHSPRTRNHGTRWRSTRGRQTRQPLCSSPSSRSCLLLSNRFCFRHGNDKKTCLSRATCPMPPSAINHRTNAPSLKQDQSAEKRPSPRREREQSPTRTNISPTSRRKSHHVSMTSPSCYALGIRHHPFTAPHGARLHPLSEAFQAPPAPAVAWSGESPRLARAMALRSIHRGQVHRDFWFMVSNFN